MALHQLAIAKASFSAGLLRPDPTSLTREDITHLHSLLNAAVIQCTPRNVQKCKHWILENIAHSTARFTALGKYLTALTASFTLNGPPLDSTSKREPSIKRKRLHLLYLVNDILYHTKYRVNDASICGKVQPILVSLLGSAASFSGCPKHHGKIQDLLKVWEENGYYSKEYIEKLREAVKNASEVGEHEEGNSTPAQNGDQDATSKVARSVPYVMPAVHGDPSTPWFDLPAGNLMPHIVPNSTRPINPDMIKPLQFVAGPADDDLVLAVKGLLDDVQRIYGETEQDDNIALDIDELGQPIILDEITGEVLEGEGYYGWSRSFCEKMKRRRKGQDEPDGDGDRGRTSRSQSRSSGRSRKWRRYSQSDDGSSPEDHRRSRTRRNYSSSRSRSPDVQHRRSNGQSRSRSRNKSYSSSPPGSSSPTRPEQYPRDAGHPSAQYPQGLPPMPPMPPNPPGPFQGYNAQFPPPPPPFPPPPNMNFNSWPPPPPPLHSLPNNFNPSNPSQNWPPPPPPPPPPHFQQQSGYPPAGPGGWQPPTQHGNGRGYNNSGWNNAPSEPPGRGGRGYYRGRGW